ncbi:MAG TPA: prephenate dehydrogenase/arogenate dehydrogenase family protein [Longimicrobiales bacterium]|nr:prephenate dehydrogenase/arogenate dehydrogenase family protein [Longimicrobiales bacterium]
MTPGGDAGGAGAVAVVGLGLIGGSIARDLAADGVPVTGVDRDAAVLRSAAREGVLRDAAAPGDPLPGDVELVVVAIPVPVIPAFLARLAGAAPGTGPVVTDVASTKRSVLAAAAAAGLGRRFVGGHPMAGDHRSGWAASRRGLFAGTTTWICPGAAESVAVARVTALWTRLGARPARIDPERHDHLVALSSHLPQAASSALAAVLARRGVAPADLGPGGIGATRLAGSDPDLWTGILLDNAAEVAPALDDYGGRLAALRAALLRGDAAAVRGWLAEGGAWASGSP